MSGARLCALLGELGYNGANSLNSDSFEWPFQYSDARPILDWICTNLRPSNVLSLAELSHVVVVISSRLFTVLYLLLQYEQFVDEGKLLEGEDLDFTYDSISAFSARRDNHKNLVEPNH